MHELIDQAYGVCGFSCQYKNAIAHSKAVASQFKLALSVDNRLQLAFSFFTFKFIACGLTLQEAVFCCDRAMYRPTCVFTVPHASIC